LGGGFRYRRLAFDKVVDLLPEMSKIADITRLELALAG